jgi:hypothetical protein
VKRYWEIITDNLSKAGWSWGCVAAVDCEQVAGVEETPSPPPQSQYPAKLPSANATIGAADISPPHLVTTTRNISIGGDVLPAGTHLELLSKEGSEVHVRYKGVEYAIPISATGLK